MVFLFLFSFAISSCNRPGEKTPSEAEGKTAAGEAQESLPVKVLSPYREDIALSLRMTTSLEAEKEADVYSKTMGFCRGFQVEVGDSVRRGDLLAKLEDQEIRLALRQSDARLEKTRNDFERAETLHSEGLISKQMYQDLSLQLNLARADHELAEKRLADTSITAPISGVVTERNVKVGDLVTTTQALFKIENLDRLEARVHIPEQDYLKIRKGQEAILTVDAFPQKPFHGMVERVNPVIDSQSGTAPVTISVNNTEGILRPGMFTRIQIITAVHHNALIVPKESILIQGDKKAVYVVRDGLAREVFIKTGFQDTDRVEVLEGLTPEDRVVVMGHLGLQGDTKVRIIEERNG